MFGDRDIVCFVGDSITANGLWIAEAYQALRKKRRIKCFNCGVSGATSRTTMGYLHAECLIRNPDHVVVMLGVNDMGLELYSEKNLADRSMDEFREEKRRIFRENFESVIRECKISGAEVTICLPTPYDEVSERAEEKRLYQQALEYASSFQLAIAKKYGCSVVNFKDNLLPLLGKMDIIREDRVHPTEFGYHVMAQIFLKETGEIDECDFDTPFVFEPWNQKRYDAEFADHKLKFVELCHTYDEGYALGKSADEIKEILKKRLEANPNPTQYILDAYSAYIERGHLRAQNKGEVAKLTIF